MQVVNPQFCEERSRQSLSRPHLIELLQLSHRHTPLSEQQISALENLSDPRSVVVTTGQQVGLLGGPMYTLYKIFNAVAISQSISTSIGIPCAPVFWLEDNDHDAAEASSTYLRNESGDPQHIVTWDGSAPRRPVAERIIDADMREKIVTAVTSLSGRFSGEAQQRMLDAYQIGVSWTDAFMYVLAPYLRHWGVVTLRAQDVVSQGAHASILAKALLHNEQIVDAMRSSTHIYESGGKHAQANISDVPWFLLTKQGRQRIERRGGNYVVGDKTFTHDQLVAHATAHPDEFSPTVLTRPIIQDAVLPNVLSILGRAELAYHQQLPKAYELLGITMPLLQQRTGMTLLPPKAERNLGKVNRTIDWFKCPLEEIEHEAAAEFTKDILPESAGRLEQIDTLLAPYRKAAVAIDPTLVSTVQAQHAGITAALETLEAKLRSAAKKQHATTMERLRGLHSLIYPMNTLQERIYPLAFWEAEFGIDGLHSQIATLETP